LIADLRGGTYVVNDEVELTREPDIIRLVSETEECTASRLADELGLSERQVQRVLSGMVNRGVLERTGAGSGSSPFVYQLGTDG
jgi:predicted HTH transcriptional regulator